MQKYKIIKSNSGFTLVEAIVTLAIIAIMAGIMSTTLLSRRQTADLDTSARTLVAMLKFAKSEAIRRNEDVNLSCDNATRRCSISLNNAQELRSFQVQDDHGNISFAPETGITPYIVRFDSTGKASIPRNALIKNISGKYTIRTSPTGRIVAE